MIAVLFSFRGRIARLHYFLTCLGMGVALVALTVAFLAAVYMHRSALTFASFLPTILLSLLLAPLVIWISLALQAKRFRDMGWEPTFVIPAWITVEIVDGVAARGAPNIALGHLDQQTIVGVAVNLVLGACLIFWPSKSLAKDVSDLFGGPPAQPSSSLAPSPSKTDTAFSKGGFGRRGL